VVAGELSAHAAAKAAGFVKEKSPLQQLVFWWRRTSLDDRQEFLRTCVDDPLQSDKYEIAFGHHRIEAAKRSRLPHVGLVVAPRSDADMLLMMAHENREEFKGDHLVQVETVAATILPAVDPKTPKGHVYVVPGGTTSYTCGTVARFLNWTRNREDGELVPTRACRLALRRALRAREHRAGASRGVPLIWLDEHRGAAG